MIWWGNLLLAYWILSYTFEKKYRFSEDKISRVRKPIDAMTCAWRIALAWTLMIVCTSIYITVCLDPWYRTLHVIMCLLMGEGMACGGLPFPGTGCPIPDVDYLCLLCIDFYVWDAVSIFNHLPRMFLSTDFAFWITDWTCCHGPHLHAILRIISRGVSGLATDSPCGVWGRGWTTCLLRDSPLFGSHFKMRVGM